MKEISTKLSPLIGHFIKIGLAYSSDISLRYHAASGGAVTSLLRYLLEERLVDSVLVPRVHVEKGEVFGKYEVVRDPSKLIEYAGSIYAPVSVGDALREVTSKRLRVALVGLPCLIKGLRGAFQSSQTFRENVRVFLGLYCNNVPNPRAFRYIAKIALKIKPEEVSHVAFRGCGWPGNTTIITRTGGVIRAPSQAVWDSGFGQYFYSRACFLCDDQTAELADISFADPWTYQKDIGIGKTLIVVRSRIGLNLTEGAVKFGYLIFEELPSPLYAIQYTTLLKKTIRVTTKRIARRQYTIPPSITTIIHELDYLLGSSFARKERLWPILRIYVKARPYLFKPLMTLDNLLKPGFSRILAKVSKAWVS